MIKRHISFIGIIVLLVLLFFILPVESQDNDIKSLRQSSKALASVARSVSPSVVFIQVEGTKRNSLYPKFNMPFDGEWPFGAVYQTVIFPAVKSYTNAQHQIQLHQQSG
jgi:serine protease Do